MAKQILGFDTDLLDAIHMLFGSPWWSDDDELLTVDLDEIEVSTRVKRTALAEALTSMREASERYRARLREDSRAAEHALPDAGEPFEQETTAARAKYQAAIKASDQRLTASAAAGKARA